MFWDLRNVGFVIPAEKKLIWGLECVFHDIDPKMSVVDGCRDLLQNTVKHHKLESNCG